MVKLGLVVDGEPLAFERDEVGAGFRTASR
jgi:hypothetical protein